MAFWKKKPTADKARRGLWRRKGVRTFLILVLTAALVTFGPSLVAWGGSIGYLSTVDKVPDYDVAIVFGAGLSGSGPSRYLAGRLQVALELYEAGKVKVILVSGDNLTVDHDEPTVMAEWLVAHGVPHDKVVLDFAGIDTYSTCVRANKIFGVTSAILVSQTYHLLRAVSTCRFVGLDVVGVGDDTVRTENPELWQQYQSRELGANIKMVYEVLTKKTPILGPYETGVDDALGR